jgi:hypothetical protein
VNIVDLIKEQLSGELLGKLGSVLGQSQATTTKAATAAVPSLLSVLMGLASTPGGTEKVLSALKSFDASSLGSVVNSLRSGNVTEVQGKGGDLLGSLLGGGTLASLVGTLSKFAGIDSTSLKGLLGSLLPLVLGVISSQFKNKPLTGQGLTSFFQEQKANINAAMPAGLSLADIPGLGAVRSAAGQAASAVPPAGLPSWLLPAAAIAVLALAGAWYYMSQATPEVAPAPEVANLPKATPIEQPRMVPQGPDVVGDLTKLYTSATSALEKVKDVPTAEAAIPTLEGFVGTVDKLKPLVDKLPDTAKTALAALQSKNLGTLKDLVAKVLAIPGVSEKLKPILDGLITKLGDLKPSS